MENPYQSPAIPGLGISPPTNRGLVGHVRVISILSIVEGVLETLFGGYCITMGFVIPMLENDTLRNDLNFRQGANTDDQQTVFWVMGATYLAGGVITSLGGITRIVAGIRNYQFRNRALGIVSCILGLGSILTCYCLPTSAAMAIYGLIVLFNGPVTVAFRMRTRDYTSDQILATTYFPPMNSLPIPPQAETKA